MSDQAQLPMEVETAIREVLDFAREIMDITKPLAPLGDELVGIAWDWLRFYRYKNALAIRDKVHDIHRERGIHNMIPIPPRLGIPLLDAASMEGDPILQEMWAGLIANATDPNKRQDPKKVFTHILSNLEPLDIQVLKFLIDNAEWHTTVNRPGKEFKVEDVLPFVGIPSDEIKLSLNNLERVGCLRFRPSNIVFSGVADTSPYVAADVGDYHLMSLAVDLSKACEP